MSLLVLAAGGLALAQLAAEALPWELRGLFEDAAARVQTPDVDPQLLMALAWKESGFRPGAIGDPNVNNTRDYGLMQINSINLERFGLTPDTAVTDPAANVHAAARLLAELRPFARNRGDLVSMYNAGQDRQTKGPRITISERGAVSYINAPYVEDVLLRYWYVRVAYFAPFKARVT